MLSSSIALASVSAHVGPWAGGWGWLFLLIPLFWISIIALIVTFSRRRWARYGYGPGYGYGYGPAAGPWNAAGAEQTLADRFARGDIDEVEYRARLEVLRAGRSAG